MKHFILNVTNSCFWSAFPFHAWIMTASSCMVSLQPLHNKRGASDVQGHRWLPEPRSGIHLPAPPLIN